MTPPEQTAIEAATDRLLATVEALPDDTWRVQSLCSGWSRAHVVAHVALNAEGLAGVLGGLADGRPTTMYVSDERRDSDIAELGAGPVEEIRRRLTAACAAFADAEQRAGVVAAGTTFDRTPGGQVLDASLIPLLRLREVEIHHGDLVAGYGPEDWPAETAREFLAWSARRHRGPGFHVDADGWLLDFGTPGAEAPTLSGPVAALAWWATGRDPGPVLSSTDGTLPTMGGR
ncbi:maleylpyruvate isomerase family mycothiol-dependent enzyme [Nocardioides caeni]|uniref:maleylpyruvate isomerase family mycothiol-dependent enzyme n=1 Tax=Nocardioides caeni TaxID=574700 RepID=UPI0031E74AC3